MSKAQAIGIIFTFIYVVSVFLVGVYIAFRSEQVYDNWAGLIARGSFSCFFYFPINASFVQREKPYRLLVKDNDVIWILNIIFWPIRIIYLITMYFCILFIKFPVSIIYTWYYDKYIPFCNRNPLS
jgi:hypothetical protein